MRQQNDAQQPSIAAEGCDVWAAALLEDGSEVQWAHIRACSNGDCLTKDIASMPPKEVPPGQPFATGSLFDREVVLPVLNRQQQKAENVLARAC